MAIYIGNKEIEVIYIGSHAIDIIYKGAKVVWEAVRSCFGSGMWVPEKPWLAKEGWKLGRKRDY